MTIKTGFKITTLILSTVFVFGCAILQDQRPIPEGCEDSIIWQSGYGPTIHAVGIIAVHESARKHPEAIPHLREGFQGLIDLTEQPGTTYTDVATYAMLYTSLLTQRFGTRLLVYGELLQLFTVTDAVLDPCDAELVRKHAQDQIRYLRVLEVGQ